MKFIVQPPNVIVGKVITPAIIVDLEISPHAFNNVTLLLAGVVAPDQTYIRGVLTKAAVEGKATFDISIERPGKGYKLVAQSPGLPDVTSESFDVNLA
jgi:hypothetical protein